MTITATPRQQRDRRIFLGTFTAGVLLAFAVFAWTYGPSYIAYWNYAPQEGDILFQSLPHSRLVNAIEGISQSPYSHCGLVSMQNGRWVVFEAFRNVEETPLKDFIFRGRQQGFAAYRLKDEYRHFIPAIVENSKQFLGRPYDVRYRMDDERIYCTELIYKAYRGAARQPLGRLSRLGDLNWRPYEATIEHFEGGPAPLDREMITPREMAKAPQLSLVYSYQISINDPGSQ